MTRSHNFIASDNHAEQEIDRLPEDLAWIAVIVGIFVWMLSLGGYQ